MQLNPVYFKNNRQAAKNQHHPVISRTNKFHMSLELSGIHHIAIICSDYERSKKFYTEVLNMTILREVYREERQSYKLDLALGSHYVIELFSFPSPAPRPSRPEACGLRHLAFQVSDIDVAIKELASKDVVSEPIRIDPYTGKRFTFFTDPDGLPLELYEI
jgi:glyoxylase I family protein